MYVKSIRQKNSVRSFVFLLNKASITTCYALEGNHVLASQRTRIETINSCTRPIMTVGLYLM